MKRIKILVDQILVRQLLSAGVKSYTIEKRYGVPRSVSEDIDRGVARPYWMKTVRGNKAKKGMCVRCNAQPIYEGFKYLCWDCWKENPGCALDEYGVQSRK